jgi:hypothetical protein
MTKNQVLILALKSLQMYDQCGYISDHKLVIREIVKALPDDEALQEQLAISSMLMLHAIEKAKKV